MKWHLCHHSVRLPGGTSPNCKTAFQSPRLHYPCNLSPSHWAFRGVLVSQPLLPHRPLAKCICAFLLPVLRPFRFLDYCVFVPSFVYLFTLSCPFLKFPARPCRHCLSCFLSSFMPLCSTCFGIISVFRSCACVCRGRPYRRTKEVLEHDLSILLAPFFLLVAAAFSCYNMWLLMNSPERAGRCWIIILSSLAGFICLVAAVTASVPKWKRFFDKPRAGVNSYQTLDA